LLTRAAPRSVDVYDDWNGRLHEEIEKGGRCSFEYDWVSCDFCGGCGGRGGGRRRRRSILELLVQ